MEFKKFYLKEFLDLFNDENNNPNGKIKKWKLFGSWPFHDSLFQYSLEYMTYEFVL